ncbi:MAG: homocysteine S-methyltransferase family protein [Candidatus Woesearchaeota archaeon]
MDFLKKLKNDFILCAEGYLFEMERRGYLKAGPFVPEVTIDFPKALEELHNEFVRAGSDVVLAFTYYAHRDKLKIIGRENDLLKMNKNALKIAKKVARENKVLFAGNISNTWVYDPKDESSKKTVRKMFTEQVRWAKDAGVDFVVGETFGFLGEAEIALDVIKSFGLKSVITYAVNSSEKTWDGYSWVEACKRIEDLGADVVGLNCLRGPDTMMPLLKKIRKALKGNMAALPVPYHTTKKEPIFQSFRHKGKRAFPIDMDSYVIPRCETARFAAEARKLGVNYIGLCCGAGPHHIRAMAEELGRTVPASKYSPDMKLHGLYGTDKVVRKNYRSHRKDW